MTDDGDHFQSAVRGVKGTWPRAPSKWSYSSLKEAEECPRRWMLSRAAYAGIWERTGYPPRPILAGLVGNVIHGALEVILRALHSRGCGSIAEPCAVDAMKALGGYSKLVEDTIESELGGLQDNPRAADRIGTLRADLLKRVPDIRQRVQAVISRTMLEAQGPHDPGTARSSKRERLTEGSYPEVELRAEDLRFVGRADLITVHKQACVMTDYKTGAPDARHADQLRTYALLWEHDDAVNPHTLPIEQLILSYATHNEAFDPPTESELHAQADQLVSQIAHAENEFKLRPPPAYPALEMCRLCSVRHLCDDYWANPAENAAPDSSSKPGDFVDCELDVESQNGPRSWVVTLAPESERALLRTATENPGFSVGDRVRLLGLAFARDDDSGRPTLTTTQASEVFVLES